MDFNQFGPRLSAMTTLLRVDARLSIMRTKELLRDLFGVEVSTGTLSNIDQRSSQLMEAAHKELHEHTKGADLNHLDETVWYLQGKRYVLWCAVSAMATLMLLQPQRDQDQAKELVGEDYQGLAITDRYCAYHWLDGNKRQMCWAHLLRDLGLG